MAGRRPPAASSADARLWVLVDQITKLAPDVSGIHRGRLRANSKPLAARSAAVGGVLVGGVVGGAAGRGAASAATPLLSRMDDETAPPPVGYGGNCSRSLSRLCRP
jgi:hypothetical protein